MQFNEDPDMAILTVADNGRGINAAEVVDARSIGLVGMRERAQAFDGSIEFVGTAGGGTTVCLRIPIDLEKTSGTP